MKQALLIPLAFALAAAAAAQSITSQPPIHTNYNYNPSAPMMTIQAGPTQTGDLFDFLNSSGVVGCGITAAAALSCPNGINAPVSDRGGQVFNVMAYGAKCDGVTDNTAAINAAIAAASAGGIIFFPACSSTYNFASSISFGAVIVEGAGQAASKLNFTGTGTAVTFNYPIPSDGYSPGLRNISLSGPGATGSTVGLVLGGSSGAVGALVENVRIANFGTGLSLGGYSYLWSVRGSWFSDGIDVNLSAVATSGENLDFDHCTFDHTSTGSAVIVNGGINLVRFMADSFDGVSLEVMQGYVDVIAGHFEDTVTGSYYFASSGDGTHNAYLKIDGGEFWYDGNATLTNASFSNVQSGSSISLSNITMCAIAGNFNIVNSAAGSEVAINNPIGANCGGYFNHPYPVAGAGTLTQISGAGFAGAGYNLFAQPIQEGSSAGPLIESGALAPSGSCINGSLYSNTAGASGSTLYACVAGAWVDVK